MRVLTGVGRAQPMSGAFHLLLLVGALLLIRGVALRPDRTD